MFNNLHKLIATMSDEKSCRDYLIKENWNGVITCPYCGFEKTYVIENGKRFKCLPFSSEYIEGSLEIASFLVYPCALAMVALSIKQQKNRPCQAAFHNQYMC